MKIFTVLLLLCIALGTLSSCKSNKSSNKIFLVRHAEKADDGTKDPPLTGEGIRRAETLADLLKYENIKKVYSTDFKRTRETAKPMAHRSGVDVVIYDPRNIEFARKLRNDLETQSVLVVGHSNSTPSLVNAITGEKYDELDESNYTTYFVVSRGENEFITEVKSF